jgi:two-component system LytT family response regulator
MSTLSSLRDIKTLLVDDEEVAIRRLRQMLSRYPDISIIGEATDGPSAVAIINERRPELVFLDIQMPGLDGFGVLGALDYTPMIVFLTAYEEYAVKAFEKESLDYLLKPVEAERLDLTIQRVARNRATDGSILEKIQRLVDGVRAADTITTIPVKAGNRIQLVSVADVYFFAAKDKYVMVHEREGQRLIEYPLSWLEHRLPPEFIRVHRGYIVNKVKIREIHRFLKGTFVIIMDDGASTAIKTAWSYSETVKARLLSP